METKDFFYIIVCIVLTFLYVKEKQNYNVVFKAWKQNWESEKLLFKTLENRDAIIVSLKNILKTHNIDLGNLLENIEQKVINKKEAESLIKECVLEAVRGYQDWLKHETDIVEKETKKVLPNTAIEIRPDTKSLMKDYVYPRLAKLGVIWENIETNRA